MVRRCFCVIVILFGLLASGCAGDTRESFELPYRRDNWDVQKIYIRTYPDNYVSWCTATNDRFSLSLHSVPGTMLVPVRGGDMNILCLTHRGLVGSKIVSREKNGRWPDEIEVLMTGDHRVEEVHQARPGPVMVAPPSRR